MNTGERNTAWGAKLIDLLRAWGIADFFVAPGARSSPLVAALSRLPSESVHVHFDERGLGFYALGFAKAANRPVAVVTTSGSAVTNLHPAVVEAFQDEIPLLLLTADRPPELRDTGANQTITQPGIFGPSVLGSCQLPCPDDGVLWEELESQLREAVEKLQGVRPGPFHVNVPFREPLLAGELPEAASFLPERPPQVPVVQPELPTTKEVQAFFSRRGVLLLGRFSHSEHASRALIFEFAEQIGWPVIADPLSGASLWKHGHLISHADLLAGYSGLPSPEVVLHLGGSYTSKRLSSYFRSVQGEHYWHIHSSAQNWDPFQQSPNRIRADASVLKRFGPLLPPSPEAKSWLSLWQKASRAANQVIGQRVDSGENLSEPRVSRLVADHLTSEDTLFLGNSMPIRDFDAYAAARSQCEVWVVGNRGASGIDGNLASVAGIARASRRPVIAVLGDLAVLHDLNSLALLTHLPVTLVVVNNGGGGIFHFLPLPVEASALERLWVTPHTMDFSHAAAQFGIEYAFFDQAQVLEQALASERSGKKARLLEVRTQRETNYRLHREVTTLVGEAVAKVFQ